MARPHAILTCLLLLAVAGTNAGADGLALGNAWLSWRMAERDGRPAYGVLSNRLSGRQHKLALPGLSLRVNGEDVRAADFDFVSVSRGAGAVLLRYRLPTHGISIVLRQEVAREAPCLYCYVELRAEGGLAPLIQRIHFGPFKVSGKPVTQGLGQPVCVGDLFLGIEHPAALNQCVDGAVTLTQCPARRLTGTLVSKPLAIGVGGEDGALAAFRRYLEGRRLAPARRGLFVNYNTWWTLMPPTEQNCLELIGLLRRKLTEAHGESLDAFTIDDGWDVHDSLWAEDSERFPRGLAPLLPELEGAAAGLGLWVSPSSGYSHGPWCEAHGYAVGPDGQMACFADTKYAADMTQRVQQLAREYRLRFIKLDGFYPGVPRSGLDDIRNDPEAAREANCDGYISLLKSVRAGAPSVYLDATCGMWLSPYWLFYVDSVWGELGGDYPAASVPAPIHRQAATTTRDAYFRRRLREYPAFPADAMETLGIIVITPEPWQDNAMAVLGRGSRLLTLYIDPRFLSTDADWPALTHMVRWARANARTLAHTELVGGDPTERVPYGFVHLRKGHGILSVRNPFISARRISVRLGPALGPGSFRLRTLYPFRSADARTYCVGDTLGFQLQGYEQRTAELIPVGQEGLVVTGCRYALEQAPSGSTHCRLYGRPGQAADVAAYRDGKPLWSRLIRWPGKDRRVAIAAAPARIAGGADAEAGPSVVGKASITLPEATQGSRLLILCESGGRKPAPPSCRASRNGELVECEAIEPREREQGYWFAVPLQPGRNDLEYTLSFQRDVRAQVSAWAEVRWGLSVQTVTLDVPFDQARMDCEPLPSLSDGRRLVYPVHAAMYVVRRSWPEPSRKVVYLDELEPDEMEQEWGELQLRQSVWQKPMTIAGRQYERGIGTHANGRVAYILADGRFRLFRCEVGRDEHAGDGRVAFRVRLDGRTVYDSGPLTKGTPAKAVEVDVRNARLLELVAADGGDGISGDHADWANARLVR